MQESVAILCAVIVGIGLVWIPAVVLIWKAVSAATQSRSSENREVDRERHDLIALVERIIEKQMADPKWTANVHAEERDRGARYNTSLEREAIRQDAQPEPSTEIDPNVQTGWPHGKIAPIGDNSEVLSP
jgi:hypothetical protein